MENSGEPQLTWTRAEDDAFEAALVSYPDGTPERWRRIAGKVDGKSPEEVEKHYDDLVNDVVAICSGLVPLPEYNDEPVIKVEVGKKKGKAWSPEEHLLFLQGLEQYGKGDWRSISRNVVKSKTATQVASHAQKYFNRLNAKNKGRRTSIHDLTLDVSNPVPISSSTQNFYEGSSFGYDSTTNVNCNQEGLLVTNNESISPTSQAPNHRGSQGHDNSNNDETHLYYHSSIGEAGIPQHLNSPSARFPHQGGVTLNGCPSNMYYQGGLSEYNNAIALRNKHSISSPNQFPMENNGYKVNMNGHLISPQSQFSPNGGLMGYHPANMIGQSTPPPSHLYSMYSHIGPQLPNSQTIHMPRRSLYIGNDDTKVVPFVGSSDNQVKANDGSTSLPGQFPDGHKQASF